MDRLLISKIALTVACIMSAYVFYSAMNLGSIDEENALWSILIIGGNFIFLAGSIFWYVYEKYKDSEHKGTFTWNDSRKR